MPASTSEPASPRISFGAHSDVGKRRENNEDSARCDVLAPGTPAESTLLMVSDGVGGSTAGEVASRTAVDSIHEILSARLAREAPPLNRRGWIDAAIRAADARIRQAATQPELAGMAATLSVLWICGHKAWWGQVGDSRIYACQRGEVRQISRDQSPVGRQRADGELTEEQARAHPYRHLIDQCLGGSGSPAEPETGALDAPPGSVFLLCSDGLSDGLWDREIAEVLRGCGADQPPARIARVLVDRANEASGRDNITAVVARIDGGSGRPASRRAWFPWLG